MKNRDLKRLETVFHSVSELKGVKFAYAVAKNFNMIKPSLEALEIATRPSKEFTEHERAREDICLNHCKKNEDGSPQIIGQAYQMKDQAKFKAEVKKLKTKNAKAIAGRAKQIEDFEKLLDEDIGTEFDFHKVKVEDLPVDISAGQIDNLKEIIDGL